MTTGESPLFLGLDLKVLRVWMPRVPSLWSRFRFFMERGTSSRYCWSNVQTLPRF